MNFTDSYLEIVQTKFAGLNLTRILERDDFHNKQYLDSVKPLEIREFKEALENSPIVIDVGFGGGFPILPLASELPSVKFNGIEARRKKADAVMEIARDLNLVNVRTFHIRLEEIFFDEPAVLIFKAVGKINDYLKYVNTNQEITAFFYKGPGYKEQDGIDKLKGWNVVLEKEIEIPGTEKRMIIGLKNVLRGTSESNKKNKKLVNISELL